MNRNTKLILKIFLWILGSIVGLVILIFILIRIPSIQNFAVQKVVSYLENKIDTKVSLKRISLDFPKLLVLEGVYFEDQKQDTLLAGDYLKVDISLLKLLKNTVEINALELRGITAHINRTLPDSAFNFDYIIEAFADPNAPSTPSDTSAPMTFSIDRINLDNINIKYSDDVIGTSANVSLEHLDTRIKTFDLDKMRFTIPKIKANGLTTVLKQWKVETDSNASSINEATTEENPLDIQIGKLDLKNVDIQYEDAFAEMKAKVIFKNLQANFNEISLPNEKVDLKSLVLEGTDASISLGKLSQSDTASSTPTNWKVAVSSINLKNNRVAFDDNTATRLPKGMDYSHLNLSNLNLGMKDLYFSMDSISGDINSFTLLDKSGLEVKNLRTNFSYTDKGASLKKLYLETPNTIIRNEIIARYPSVESLTDHPENLVIDATLKESKLGMKDIILLVPDLDTMQVMQPLLTHTFFIDGKVNGRVDNLNIPNLKVTTLDRTRLSLSGRITGLPNVNNVLLNLTIKELISTRKDLNRLIDKSLLPDSIALPENIRLAGTFKGGKNGFNTDMKLKSSIGDASVDGKFIFGKIDTLYDARVSIADFDLGNFMQDTTYGKINFSANVKGKGFDPATAIADIQADLKQADFMGYSYSAIKLNAKANAGDIIASVISDDPNLKLNGNIKADMRGKYPAASLELMIDSINFTNLKFTEDEMRYHGKIEGNFTTADPDYLNGQLVVINSEVAYNGKTYPIDSIALTSEANEDFKFINLESDFLNAHIMGDYKLTELATAIQDVVQVYYNPEKTQITKKYSPQAFEFSAELNRSPIIIDLVPTLTEMKNITFDGNFSSENKSINARLAAPHTVYDGMLIDTVSFDLNTADSTFYYTGRIGEVKISNIQIINTLISGTVKDNLLDLGMWIKDKKEKEQYHLGATILAENKDFILKLKQDGLTLNFDKWEIAKDNQIIFGEKGTLVNDFTLTSNKQKLALQSESSILNAPINVVFNDFRIETFTKFLETNTLKIGGGINGTVLLSRLESSPVFESDLTVNRFYFGNDTIGDINMKVDNKRENVYAANVTISGNGNDINLSGDVMSPPKGATSLDIILNMTSVNMTTLEAFSFGNLQHSKGTINGELAITGTTQAPLIKGDLLFNKAKTNISMLNALFLFDQQKINFNDEGIKFTRFEIADSIGNKATLNGTVKTKTYTDFAMNLTLSSRNFQVVNSTAKDNDLFYGKMFLTTDLKIQGTVESPKVDGTLKINANTDFTVIVPDENPGMVDREGIVEFIDKSAEDRGQIFAQKDSVITSKVLGMDMSFNIEVDPKAVFNIIIDPGSGDAVTAKGKAELVAGIDPSGKVTLSGTYEVSEGSYNLSFNFLTRKFDFRKGSTITWTGDPLSADLNITADYLIKAPSIDLVENQVSGENANFYKEKLPFQVNLFIKGEMMKPLLSFGIDVNEENSSVSQDVMSLVKTRLAQISENESELNKQVFALIVLGRFVAENPFSSSAGGSVESMARESVSKLLSSQLNRLAGDLIAGVDLNFDLESKDDYSSGNLENRTELNVGVSKRLLDDRLKITVGSNFELEGASQPGRQTTNIAGDVSIEYQLSRDGRYLLKAYRKNEYEVTLQGQVVETGIGFIINMNYDAFKELFLNAKSLERYKSRKERRERLKYLSEKEVEDLKKSRMEERERRRKERTENNDEENEN